MSEPATVDTKTCTCDVPNDPPGIAHRHWCDLEHGDPRDDTADPLGWCVLELMGHRRLAGHISEQEVAGAAFLRLDIPTDPPITQLYNAKTAVYCITPTTEDIARRLAARQRPEPVSRYELPPLPPAQVPTGSDDDQDDDGLTWSPEDRDD